MTAKTLPSVTYLTNFQLIQFNNFLPVSEWDVLPTTLEEYVDQRLTQSYPSTHPILNIAQSTPLVSPKITQQTRRARR